MTTGTSPCSLLMPAEWAPHSACLILFPHNPQTFRLERAQAEILNLAQQIVNHGKEDVYLLCKDEAQAKAVQRDVGEMKMETDNRIHVGIVPSDDTWARDTAPIFVWQSTKSNHNSDDTATSKKKLMGLDWRFNAYGGPEEGCYWPCDDDQQIAQRICDPCGSIAKTLNIQGSISVPMVLEGGSIQTDGEGTLLTTKECLLNPNRNPHLTQEEIELILKESLGVQKILWLPKGLDADEDTNGHVDNICCFVEPSHVALAWTDDLERDPENHERCREAMDFLQQSTDAKGRSLKITKLYLPSPSLRYTKQEAISLVETLDGAEKHGNYVLTRQPNQKMAASYVNFYIANQAVLVPQFGAGAESTDAQAIETLQQIFEDRKVVGIPSREILLGGGNIHCQTQQVPFVTDV